MNLLVNEQQRTGVMKEVRMMSSTNARASWVLHAVLGVCQQVPSAALSKHQIDYRQWLVDGCKCSRLDFRHKPDKDPYNPGGKLV